ncbi:MULTISPECIES: response regulator [Mesorhizobium]|uniref:CheY-like chemotaxis protein n=1 Tax=Mesorhizobium shonense TaxID=1209948 RepID=A0ABV2I166_9HYPH|nr:MULTISPECIES: response regulator [unclassified Mesorhizobium]
MKPAGRGPAARLTADFSKVLVVGKSSINRVVVSKIVEKSGLKPISESPETAEKALAGLVPGAIILDGGPDDKDCDGLLSGIDALRRASDRAQPSVILLSTRNGTPDSLGLSSVIDAVVAKPITPERLQPVIERLVGRG